MTSNLTSWRSPVATIGLLLAIGCARKLEIPAAPPPGTTPSLHILSPSASQSVGGLPVTVQFQFDAFTLDPPGSPVAHAHGHILLRPDDGPPIPVFHDTVTVVFPGPGAHILRAELRTNDGVPLDPQIADSVAFAITLAPSLSHDVQPIFTAHCTTPGCHINPGAILGEDLSTPGSSYATTVNVISREQPSRQRVVPGDPDQSYTVNKVRGDASISGQRMPLGGPYLSPQEIQTLVDWIRAGARND